MIVADTVEFPVIFLGAIRAGIVPAPLNTLLSPEQFAYILEDSRARVLFVSQQLLAGVEPALAMAPNILAALMIGVTERQAASPTAAAQARWSATADPVLFRPVDGAFNGPMAAATLQWRKG